MNLRIHYHAYAQNCSELVLIRSLGTERHAPSVSRTISGTPKTSKQSSSRQLFVLARPNNAYANRLTAQCSATHQHSLQLATAKLPKSVQLSSPCAQRLNGLPKQYSCSKDSGICRDVPAEAFTGRLYDWASTMTSSGRNLPFALPLRTRQIKSGFEIALLRISNGEAVAVGKLQATVDNEPNVGNVLFVRFFEGEGAQLVRSSPLPEDPVQRLKIVLDGLVDVPLIMGTMRSAIRQAAVQAK